MKLSPNILKSLVILALWGSPVAAHAVTVCEVTSQGDSRGGTLRSGVLSINGGTCGLVYFNSTVTAITLGHDSRYGCTDSNTLDDGGPLIINQTATIDGGNIYSSSGVVTATRPRVVVRGGSLKSSCAFGLQINGANFILKNIVLENFTTTAGIDARAGGIQFNNIEVRSGQGSGLIVNASSVKTEVSQFHDNAGAGIMVGSGSRNYFRRLQVYNNGGYGIVLGSSPVCSYWDDRDGCASEAPPGNPNGLIPPPTIRNTQATATTFNILGTYPGGAGGSIEIYQSDRAASETASPDGATPRARGYGQGRTLLTTIPVTSADGSFSGQISAAAGSWATALMRKSDFSGSEFALDTKLGADPDADGDGLTLSQETALGTCDTAGCNATCRSALDCDGDCVNDGTEVLRRSNPTDPNDSDSDGDGVYNYTEDTNHNCTYDAASDRSNLGNSNTDGDATGGVPLNDSADNCPKTFNSDQADADGDRIGNACDTCTDKDGDTYAPANQGDSSCAGGVANDCNDDDPAMRPGGTEVCGNGKDDDCSAGDAVYPPCRTGETRSCYTGPGGTDGQGICHGGTQTCTNNSWNGVGCVGEVRPATELCGNGTDEDCNGTDPACPPPDGDGDGVPDLVDCDPDDPDIGQTHTWACYTGPAGTSGVGACHDGTETCTDGLLGACTGQVTPGEEICGDGIDQDCDGGDAACPACTDGQTQPCYGGPEETAGVGICQAGNQTCAGGTFGECVGQVTPGSETCGNGADEDCDGADLQCPPGGSGPGGGGDVCSDGSAPDDVGDSCNHNDCADRTLRDVVGDPCNHTDGGSPVDADGDGIIDAQDNCPITANPDQRDTDADRLGDACEIPIDISRPPGEVSDTDGDGLPDEVERQLGTDPNLIDTDSDGVSDSDEIKLGRTPTGPDTDGDGAPDGGDNCFLIVNPDQIDTDGDGIGDACDLNMSVAGETDADNDLDQIPDINDNCPGHPNEAQQDTNGDGNGDACDLDDDGDGLVDVEDNCPAVVNNNQADADADGVGDACPADADGDLIPDFSDNCPLRINADQIDADGNGIGDTCELPIDLSISQRSTEESDGGCSLIGRPDVAPHGGFIKVIILSLGFYVASLFALRRSR